MTAGTSHPTSGGGPTSQCPTRTTTQHDSTHRESDVIMLLPTASTPLNTLSRVVALRSASVRSHAPVLLPGSIFHRHSTVSLTRNVLGTCKNLLF